MKYYKIGDFSKICGLTEKTLRYYHDEAILVPDKIDEISNYRFYSENLLQKVEIIKKLRDLDFSIIETRNILLKIKDDKQLKKYFENKLNIIDSKVEQLQSIKNKIIVYLKYEKDEKKYEIGKIKIKKIPDILVAAVRFKGLYEDEPIMFKKLVDACGAYCNGSAMSMCYGSNIEKEQFDIELAMPVSKEINTDFVKTRILKGGKTVALNYKGDYKYIGKAYKILIDYINDHHFTLQGPPREIAIKGVWTIIPRLPKNFVTEIQFLIS
jgi:DNA-binding transcriptional MerR regulator